METKRCRLCGEEKPLTDFHRSASRKDGHHSACKPCAIAEQNRSRLKSDIVVTSADGVRMKMCAHCKELKPLEDFVRNKNFGDGRNHVCKACLYPQRKTWGKTDQGKAVLAAIDRRQYYADVTATRNQRNDRTHKLPIGTYRRLYEFQEGKCAICERTGHVRGQRIGIDHNAATGAVRGLLCTPCNQALGQLQESPELFRRAIAYLENPPALHLNLTSGFKRRPK